MISDGKKVSAMDGPVIVIDVPIATSAEDAAKILSEPVTRGYYVRGVAESNPMRVVFAQYAPTENKCADELRAMAVVVANKAQTATRIVQMLCEQGIYRGTPWVNKTRDELV
jgi:hypothetical protein